MLGHYNVSTKMTIGADFFVKRLHVNGVNVTLQIWDFGGEERFRFLLPQYVAGSSGGIFMFDITRYTSLKNFDDWLEIFREEYSNHRQSNSTLPIFMVGGKKDLEDSRSVESDDAIEIVQNQRLYKYKECSSKTGENVEEIFEDLTRELLRRVGIVKTQSI
jgi:small GTP-binding protein